MSGDTSLDDTVEMYLDWNPLTPVCCHCGRQKTAAGEWRDRAPVAGERITHGICPPCIRLLYPEYAELVEAG